MLEKDIRYLKGVGEARAALFEKKGVKTIKDLLYFFPRDYEDRTQIKAVEDTVEGETVCVRATVFSPVKEVHIRKNLAVYSTVAHDETGALNLIWYNNRFVKQALRAGDTYIFYGKVLYHRGKREMANPIYELETDKKYTGKIIPLYPLTGSLTQKIVQMTMEQAVSRIEEVEETLPGELREQYGLIGIQEALSEIHFPKDGESYLRARKRLAFEELFMLQMALFWRRGETKKENANPFLNTDCVQEFVSRLPFFLTSAQERVLADICTDIKGSHPMNRLIQGDVGSGKTAVAAAAMYIAVRNGYQAAIMAPTEILAKQHYETFSSFFEPYDMNIVLLTGSMTAKEKRLAYADIAGGFADIVVGTHAIIQEGVAYQNLGLVVADEQHRFGVGQRAELVGKGNCPHMLIMTATPIPRTLALILYGDLDVSAIDELPPGRKPVKTYAVEENMRRRIYGFLDKNIKAGMQAYVVCPLVEETEQSDLKDAVAFAKRLERVFPYFTIGLVHGKMRAKEKEAVMAEFSAGKIHILVSTTVIEVGVNVPNANMMIIENAERFGLSQLHQLRGRVGRGGQQAYCVLVTNASGELTKKRMQTMCESNDGFYISEQDLKLRGPGDFFGTRQHGLPELKIANLFEDMDILKQAQEAANIVFEKGLESEPALKKRMDEIFMEEIVMN